MWIIVLHIVLHNYATNFQLQTGNYKLRIANYKMRFKFKISEHFDTDSVLQNLLCFKFRLNLEHFGERLALFLSSGTCYASLDSNFITLMEIDG